MTPLTHLSSGYLIATFIKKDYYYQSASSKLKTKLILLASILPDLDFFFFKYTKDHHQSLFLTSPLEFPDSKLASKIG